MGKQQPIEYNENKNNYSWRQSKEEGQCELSPQATTMAVSERRSGEISNACAATLKVGALTCVLAQSADVWAKSVTCMAEGRYE